MNKLKIALILGTRPEIIKMSPVIRELQRKQIPFFLLHTNQHFSENMDAVFLQQLGLPKAKYNLGINASTHGRMVGEMLVAIEYILAKEKPSVVLVQGDTNTVLAAALAAVKMGIKVGHIEAGLRSYDKTMPEEHNRVAADHFSDFLFCPTQRQAMILNHKEGIDPAMIFVTGNTVVDAVKQNFSLAKRYVDTSILAKNQYLVVTMHRPSNVDNKAILQKQIENLHNVAEVFQIPLYYPIHPRAQKQLERHRITIDSSKVRVQDPVNYFEMLILIKHAKVVLTDSGGIQEEACILGTPCITLRENTERPETVDVGANILVGSDTKKLLRAVKKMATAKTNWYNPFGDGRAAKRIVRILKQAK